MDIIIRINIKSTAEESLWLADTNSSVEPKDFNALLNELNGLEHINSINSLQNQIDNKDGYTKF